MNISMNLKEMNVTIDSLEYVGMDYWWRWRLTSIFWPTTTKWPSNHFALTSFFFRIPTPCPTDSYQEGRRPRRCRRQPQRVEPSSTTSTSSTITTLLSVRESNTATTPPPPSFQYYLSELETNVGTFHWAACKLFLCNLVSVQGFFGTFQCRRMHREENLLMHSQL